VVIEEVSSDAKRSCRLVWASKRHSRYRYRVQAFEVLSDRASETGDVKMVVIGVADDAATLVGESGSVRRRTTEIGVPRMPDEETQIFKSGSDLLNLRVTPEALNNLIFYCDGFPYFAHLLGLAVARHTRRREDDLIDKDSVTAALARVAKDVSASFPKRIARALEAGGEVQPRLRVRVVRAAPVPGDPAQVPRITAAWFLRHTSAKAESDANIVTLSVWSRQRGPAVVLANAYATTFAHYKNELERRSADRTLSQIQAEIERHGAPGDPGTRAYEEYQALVRARSQAMEARASLGHASAQLHASGASAFLPHVLRNGLLGGALGALLGIVLTLAAVRLRKRA
jgi:hypothetical protein